MRMPIYAPQANGTYKHISVDLPPRRELTGMITPQGCNFLEWAGCAAAVAGCAALSGPALIACVAAAAPCCVKCVS